MKTVFPILLMALIFSACSQQNAVDSQRNAIDSVEAGKDMTWLDGNVWHVEQREGNSIQGIRIVTKLPETSGGLRTITAVKGELSEGPTPNAVTITLHDVVMQNNKGQQPFPQMVMVLKK